MAAPTVSCDLVAVSAVSTTYGPPFEFTGTIFKVTVDLSGKLIPDTDDERHARAKATMARQ